VYNFIQISIFQ